MKKKNVCALCGGAVTGMQEICLNCRARLIRGGVSLDVQLTRHTPPVILLIGLPDQEEARRQLSELGASFILCCQSTAEAEGYLREQDGDVFFLLDTAAGETACLDFLAWLLENRPAYGAIVGDSISNPLAINALNSGLIVDALPRPVSSERWRKMLDRRTECSGAEDLFFLHQRKGSKPDWYAMESTAAPGASQNISTVRFD